MCRLAEQYIVIPVLHIAQKEPKLVISSSHHIDNKKLNIQENIAQIPREVKPLTISQITDY